MQIVDQAVDGVCRRLFSDLGQAGIAGGGSRTGVAEQTLNMAQTQALFEQMGGIGMAK